MKEGEVIDYLRTIFGKNQVHRFTPGPYSPRGVFDVMIVYSGFNYWVEIKMNSTTMTSNQKLFADSVASPIVLHVDDKKKIITCHYLMRMPDPIKQLPELLTQKKKEQWVYNHKVITHLLRR